MENESSIQPNEITIIDAHVHLYDVDKFHYAWLEKTPLIRRTFETEDYAAATYDFNVERFICIEAAADERESEQEFRWLNDLSAKDSRLAGIVAHADLKKGERVREELDRIAGNPKLKGIRYALNPAYEKNPRLCLEPDFIEGARVLPEYDLSFDLVFEPAQANDVIEFVQRCANVQMIVNHTGKPPIKDHKFEPWASYMRRLAALPNVACKISDVLRDSGGATEASKIAPYIEKLMEMFGGRRLMFGSDFPVVTMYGSFKSQIDLLQKIFNSYSDDEQNDFFCRNAERIYRLA